MFLVIFCRNITVSHIKKLKYQNKKVKNDIGSMQGKQKTSSSMVISEEKTKKNEKI